MKKLIVLSAWLGTALIASPRLWIVGEGYVGHTDLTQNPTYHSTVKPTSSGLDPSRCRLWVTSEGQEALIQLDPGETPKAVSEPTGRILSDVRDNLFLSRSPDGTALQLRDASGKLLRSEGRAWVKTSEQVVQGQQGAWSLNVIPDSRRISITHLDLGLEKVVESVVSKGASPWGHIKLELDPAGGVWVGFTAPGARPYVPIVQRWSLDGERKVLQSWRDRGLFFDSCREPDGSLLVARDIASNSGYTIPFYSYLERVSPDGKTDTYYQGDLNYFIDALACEKDAIYMVRRSIFGSDGSYLFRWKREPGKLGEELFRLPNKAKKLYFCRL